MLQIDPMTREWIFPDGRRIPMLMGGSAMVHDEVTPKDTDVELDPEDDDDDDDDDRPGGGRRTGAGDDDEDWDPPTKTEYDRMKSALKNYRQEKRDLKRHYETQISNLTTSGTAAAAVEIEQTRIETEQRVEKKWVKRTVRAEAAAQFAANGATATNAERLARMVDLDKIQYDERDEEFDGLSEEIEEIMGENPEFFRKTKDRDEDEGTPRRLPRPSVDGASRGKRGGGAGGGSRRSSADKLAERALGRKPRQQ